MNKYIILDTNVIVSFFENGFSIVNQKGTLSQSEDPEVLQTLWKLLKENKMLLIIPEVVVIECERIMDEKQNELDRLHETVTNSVQNAVTVNRKISTNSYDLINKTVKHINQKEKNKIREAWKLFCRIIKHKNTIAPKIDDEIIINAYKRGLMGRKPFTIKYTSKELESRPIHDIQPDCVVVESVKKYMKDKEVGELYLCTNDSNFYETGEKKVLDINIKADLNIKESFLSISDMLSGVFKIKPKNPSLREGQEFDVYPLVGEKQKMDDGMNIDLGVVKGFDSSVK